MFVPSVLGSIVVIPARASGLDERRDGLLERRVLVLVIEDRKPISLGTQEWHRNRIGGRKRFRALEEALDADTENLGHLEKRGSRYPVRAFFILLDLLEGDVELIAERGLR